MARPLIIRPEEKEKIKKLIAFAEDNFYSREKLEMIELGIKPPPGDRKGFKIEIPVGFRCVFTIEDQPIGVCRHLSISVDNPSRLPSPAAVNMLAREFGFMGTVENLEEGSVFIDKEANAINVIQKLHIVQ